MSTQDRYQCQTPRCRDRGWWLESSPFGLVHVPCPSCENGHTARKLLCRDNSSDFFQWASLRGHLQPSPDDDDLDRSEHDRIANARYHFEASSYVETVLHDHGQATLDALTEKLYRDHMGKVLPSAALDAESRARKEMEHVMSQTKAFQAVLLRVLLRMRRSGIGEDPS